MTIEQIQERIRQLEQKLWPDHVIDNIFCEIWEDGGRWVLEARAKPSKNDSKAQVLFDLITVPLTQFKFPWPVTECQEASEATPELAFARALAYVPRHPEVEDDA